MACVMDDPQQSPPQHTDCGAPDGDGGGNLGLCFSSTNSTPTSSSPRSPVAVLRQALHSIPNQNTEYMLRSVASKLAQNLAEQVGRSGLAFITPHMYSGIFFGFYWHCSVLCSFYWQGMKGKGHDQCLSRHWLGNFQISQQWEQSFVLHGQPVVETYSYSMPLLMSCIACMTKWLPKCQMERMF